MNHTILRENIDSISILILNFISTMQGRFFKRYALVPKAPEANDINDLIQRSVESGIYGIYKRMDSFLMRLKKLSYEYAKQQDDQTEFITMDHIWIYVYVFLIANGLCVLRRCILWRNCLFPSKEDIDLAWLRSCRDAENNAKNEK